MVDSGLPWLQCKSLFLSDARIIPRWGMSAIHVENVIVGKYHDVYSEDSLARGILGECGLSQKSSAKEMV